MKSIPLVRNGLISPIISFFNDIGTPIQSHLNQFNIPLVVLEDPEIALPLPMILKFLSKVAKAEGINNLGITVAENSKIINTGMFGYLLSQSLNTYDLLKRLCYFTRYTISTSGEIFWLIEEEENVWLCQKFVKPLTSISGFYHSDYYSVVLMLDSLKLTLDDLSKIPEIHIVSCSKKAKGLDKIIDLDKTIVGFNQPFTAICIPRELLNYPVKIKHKTQIHSEKLNVEQWQNTAPVNDFVSSLEQTVKALLLDKYPTIEITAEATGLTVRSLQRYLSQHNLTYSQLMDKVRYEWALSLLNNRDISLIEISYTLGFKDPANFSHSFRRWTGVSPSKFRKYLLSH
ncbi:MAG TPA: hypothetical protein DCF68_02070 [Cyanothece sp. UBA12306]|nr:hypothetical protein [Cyanothece sp. UBA12306]